MSKRLAVTIVALGVVAGAPARAASHAVKVGETRTFGMENMNMIGSINGALIAKVGGQPMASGGTYRLLTPDLSLICGFYTDTNDHSAAIPGYAITIDKSTQHMTTFAPLTGKELEAKGCFPGERARLAREIEKLDKRASAHK